MKADVAIIGGGLSGLAAAVELARQGVDVVLIDQSPRLGGRCYSYLDAATGDVVDNGQHVLIGAYHETLRYLTLIGTRHLLKSSPGLSLLMHHPEKGMSRFELSSLPAPFHITSAMLKYSALSFNDRRKLLAVGLALRGNKPATEKRLASMSIDEWLTSLNQSEESKKSLWFPIAISIMNEQPDRASALLFARSLRSAFLGTKSDSAIFLATVGQTELYVTGAEQFLSKKKARILVNAEVQSMTVVKQRVTGISIKNGKEIRVKDVISAVPYFQLKKFLPDEMRKQTLFRRIHEIQSSPIISIHLWFDVSFMEAEYIGVIGKHVQWVFNRRKIVEDAHSRGSYLSAIISGADAYIDMSKGELVALAVEDLKNIFPQCTSAKLLHSVVIKEKRATFSPTNENEQRRPPTETSLENFYLAGDWTDTGLPATIEGAVMSGFRAAQQIMNKYNI